MGTRFSSLIKRNITRILIVTALLLTALSCDFLLLPPTGFPEDGPNARATPKGTIEHLFRAYKDRRIDLFTELLPRSNTFRFFISPDYSLEYAAMSGPDATIQTVEEFEYHFVRPGNYHYWGHERELAKHRNLFRRADMIEFREYPIIDDERDFRYRVNADNETTHVEVRMTSGELCIGLRDTVYCTQKNGQMQVFLLERETDRVTGDKLWVIRDWFDLNSL